MKIRFITLIFTLLILTGSSLAQTSWLDRPLRNWNTSGNVPAAPRATGDSPAGALCRETVRIPESIADRAVTRAGWSLFGAAQVYGAVTLINAMASVDGMCRPMQYNTFVFVSNRFAGTLAPEVMNARSDGALTASTLLNQTGITAEFARYTSTDELCCPSQTSSVSYEISGGRVQAQNVGTSLNCQNQNEPPPADANTVSGTVNYRQRSILPRDAVLNIKLIDIGSQNAPSRVIAEQTTDLNGQQVPIPFTLKFDERAINFRNDYGVVAEISSGGRPLFRNDAAVRVLTQRNPSKVEIFVEPVAGPVTDSVLRGTVNYRERIALPRDAELQVKLIDATTDIVIAEDGFLTNGRQVPLPFEIRYNRNQIDPRRRYALRAEILSGSKPIFTTDVDFSVLTFGSPAANIELMLVSAKDEEPPVVTGKSISLSKFGTGSFSLEGRGDEFLIRGGVRVQTDGKAEVTVSSLGSGITFSGNLTYADDNTLRITVSSSGNADASGEIEVKYSGRRLNSISSRDLVLDGQKAAINF